MLPILILLLALSVTFYTMAITPDYSMSDRSRIEGLINANNEVERVTPFQFEEIPMLNREESGKSSSRVNYSPSSDHSESANAIDL